MAKGGNVVVNVVNNGNIAGILNDKWWLTILSERRQLCHYVLFCLYVWIYVNPAESFLSRLD